MPKARDHYDDELLWDHLPDPEGPEQLQLPLQYDRTMKPGMDNPWKDDKSFTMPVGVTNEMLQSLLREQFQELMDRIDALEAAIADQ